MVPGSYVVGLVGVSLLLPSFALAETSAGAVPERRMANANFCTRIDTVTSKVTSGIVDRETKYHGKRAENRTKLNERFGARDLRRVENRSEWDGKREEWRTKLGDKATTPEQKAAVEAFIKGMDTAIATRRSAVDGAVKEFRAGLDAAIIARQSAVDSAVATLKQESELAVAKAKADCTSNVDPKTVRETYVTALKSAREKFRTAVKALDARKDTLQPLANARKLAIEKAVADFKTTTEQLKLKLKEAMVTN